MTGILLAASLEGVVASSVAISVFYTVLFLSKIVLIHFTC